MRTWSLVLLLTVLGLPSPAWAADPDAPVERPLVRFGLHHAELYPVQVFAGGLMGYALTNFVDGRSGRPPLEARGTAWGFVGGGAAAFILSLMEVSPSVVLGVNAGTLWTIGLGSLSASLVTGSLEVGLWWAAVLSPVGGILGGLWAHASGATPGRLALMNTAGLWAGVLALVGQGAFRFPGPTPVPTGLILGASTGALLMAGLLSEGTRVSRAQLLFVDLGGLVGLGVGGLFVRAIGWDHSGRDAPLFHLTLVGCAGAGLLLAGALVHHANLPPALSRLSLSPFIAQGGGGVAVGLSL